MVTRAGMTDPNTTKGWRTNSGTWVDDDAGEFALGLPRQVGVAQGVTSLHTQGSPYRNGNHASTSVPNTFLMSMAHHCTLKELAPPFRHPRTVNIIQVPARVSIPTSCNPSMYTPSPVTPSAVPASVYSPQHGIFYDFLGPSIPPGSQFYYPSEPTLYHPSHSPLIYNATCLVV
ncbi:hypothetical protein V8E52_007172 [Russula decolorans]